MRVGIGDEMVTVQRRKPPVHGRVRRKAGFQGVDMGRQVFETLLNGVEPGERAEQ